MDTKREDVANETCKLSPSGKCRAVANEPIIGRIVVVVVVVVVVLEIVVAVLYDNQSSSAVNVIFTWSNSVQFQSRFQVPLVNSGQFSCNLNIYIQVGSELAVNVLFKCYVIIYDVLGRPQEVETHTIAFVMNKLAASLLHFDVLRVQSLGKETNKDLRIPK